MGRINLAGTLYPPLIISSVFNDKIHLTCNLTRICPLIIDLAGNPFLFKVSPFSRASARSHENEKRGEKRKKGKKRKKEKRRRRSTITILCIIYFLCNHFKEMEETLDDKQFYFNSLQSRPAFACNAIR